MTRTMLFWAAIAAAIVCLIVALLYWLGSAGFGHHTDGPFGLKNFKHGVLFIAVMIVALLFAAVNRPTPSAPS